MSRDWDIPEQISVPIKPDDDGFIGRECPQKECEGYFKIKCGTGLKGENLPCHCPYYGHTAGQDHVWTKEQIEYAKSVAMQQIDHAIRRELKKLEFDYPARGMFGIGISMKLKPGTPLPLRHYREKRLETEVVCDRCTLRYAIYGVFAFCPDCGAHNSQQILSKNLDLAVKELDLAQQVDSPDLAEHLIADALENVVSAFDGFGREITRVNAQRASDVARAANMSFQNPRSIQNHLQALFGFDLASGVTPDEWQLAVRCFGKRHLLAHKMGVADQKYLDATNDSATAVGRRIIIREDEVRNLIVIVKKLGETLTQQLMTEDA
jgi:hypothetical protein